jgi:putative phosphoribosyl transferase
MPFQLSPRPEVLFRDRTSAGVLLAAAIAQAAQPDDSFVVYALPRGGLPVAAPISEALNCPLDIIVAKKVTRPNNPELALGAVTAEGHLLVPRAQVSPQDIQQAQAKAQVQQAQFADRTKADPAGAIALLVDDGIATGMTISVAAQSLRERQPKEIWICVPVAPKEVLESLKSKCDRLIVLATPEPFWSVSRFYQDFPQVEMEEALTYLKTSW